MVKNNRNLTLITTFLGFSLFFISGLPEATRAAPPIADTSPTPEAICPNAIDLSGSFSLDRPGKNLIEIFQPQILAYLNAGGTADRLQRALEGPFDFDGENLPAIAHIYSVDITGNEVPEVVVDFGLLVSQENIDGMMLVFTCRDEKYTSIAEEPLIGYIISEDSPDHGIRAIRDMNANGIPEIVVSQIWVIGTHVNFTRNALIYEWDETQLSNLVDGGSQSFPNTIEIQNGDFEINDTNSDGTFELIAKNGLGRGPDVSILERDYTDIWAWDGNAFTLSCRKTATAPKYRFQAVHDGDDATQCEDYQPALAFYQQAIFDEQLLGWSEGRSSSSGYQPEATPTPDPEERLRLSAYSRYRIMLLHAVQVYIPEATIVYDTLLEKFPPGTTGNIYAQMATEFWEEYTANGDITTACEAAIAFANANPEEILIPLGSGFYGWGRVYTPEDICPFSLEARQVILKSSAGYITFAINVHDILHLDESAETILRLIDLFETYNVSGDFYLTAPMVHLYTEQQTDVIARLRESNMTISYHMRPPHPVYNGFDERLQGLHDSALAEMLREYETYRLDMSTGNLLYDEPGGYSYVADTFGRPPVVVSLPNERYRSVGLPIFTELGAQMTVTYHESGTDPQQPFEWRDDLLIRPSDFSITRWPSPDKPESSPFWWNMLNSPLADLYNPTNHLKSQLEAWDGERAPFITVLIHENNFYRRAATPFALIYWQDKDKTQPLSPPFDLNAPDASMSRSPENQAAIWAAYEELVAYAATHLNVVTSEDIVALAEASE